MASNMDTASNMDNPTPFSVHPTAESAIDQERVKQTLSNESYIEGIIRQTEDRSDFPAMIEISLERRDVWDPENAHKPYNGNDALNGIDECGYRIRGHVDQFTSTGKNRFAITLIEWDQARRLIYMVGVGWEGTRVRWTIPDPPIKKITIFGVPATVGGMEIEKEMGKFVEVLGKKKLMYRTFDTVATGNIEVYYGNVSNRLPTQIRLGTQGYTYPCRLPGEPVRARLCNQCRMEGHQYRNCPDVIMGGG